MRIRVLQVLKSACTNRTGSPVMTSTARRRFSVNLQNVAVRTGNFLFLPNTRTSNSGRLLSCPSFCSSAECERTFSTIPQSIQKSIIYYKNAPVEPPFDFSIQNCTMANLWQNFNTMKLLRIR